VNAVLNRPYGVKPQYGYTTPIYFIYFYFYFLFANLRRPTECYDKSKNGHAIHDYVRLLLTKTPENNLWNRKKSLGEILMDIVYGWG
jgi:hypothetical protein